VNFEPPHIENIKQVLPVIKDNPAFVVKEKGWYTVIDYMYMSDKLFRDPIERECRGIKFCTKTGKVLARPYHKFHNLGEREAFATDKVDLRQPHVVLDKLDGSMVHTCASDLGIYLMTRMGHTEVAQQAEKFLEANQIKYCNLFNALNIDNYTFIFEYVGPSNKIVLNYSQEDLILTGIRHNNNGTYIFYDELAKLAKAFNIPLVPAKAFTTHDGEDFTFSKSEDLNSIVKDWKDTEGVVVRFDTGEMVKIKAEEYCRKHQSKELASSFKGLVSLIVENKLDDVLPQLEEPQLSQVKAYAEKINKLIDVAAHQARHTLKLTGNIDQKTFALYVQQHFPTRTFQSILFNVRKGDNARDAIIRCVAKNTSTNTKLTELFQSWEWPVWTYSFFGEE
jgi:RNA ligase